ncbi:uncharacterized protein LOC134228586 [Saccostrea cucullata]|uniref:uncharacterized protein LOC134228586 n=1 Tax=Saccostrea cuccullata TaxID=36930 RepID=UPI002ED44E8D
MILFPPNEKKVTTKYNEDDPDQEVKAYCKNIYIGDSKTLLDRMDSDVSLGPGVKKKASRLIRKNIIEAFTDAADVKITPRKPTLLQRLLYTFNRCIGRQTA